MENSEQNNQKKPKKLGIEIIVIIALVIVIAGLVIFYESRKKKNEVQEQVVEEPKISVVAEPISTRLFEKIVAVQGNLESKNFAFVSPRVAGIIEKFFVDEGNSVIANESKLFVTDSVALQQALEISKKCLDVAYNARNLALANLEKIMADFDKAEIDYIRFKRLFEKKAVTADAFELQESRYKQLIAAIKEANAEIELANSNIEKAKSDLIIAEKNLADSVIYAPITGKVSQKYKESGEMGGPGEPAMRIDDNTIIEVSAFLPAQYYSEVIEGNTKIRVNVVNKDIGQYDIYYKSPTINPKLRTFEVKCVIDNNAQTIASGGLAEIKTVLESRKGFAVPTSAIQNRDNKSVVFVVTGDKTHKVAVETGFENEGWTEVRSSELNEQSLIVTMGQNMLDEGKAVTVQRSN